MVTEKVALVIPALNEEAALHRLLAELPPNFAQWVIVVDNGSTDATARAATRLWTSLLEGFQNGVQPRG